MKLIQNENNIVSGYICDSCKCYNDILTNPCSICQTQHNNQSIIDLQPRIWYQRGGYQHKLFGLWLDGVNMSSELTIELHSQFFNHEVVLIKDMDNVQLRDRRVELQKIAFEARARLTAIDSEERDRTNKGKRNTQWLVGTGNDPNVTDAIEVVKERKARMSKIDKLRADMKKLGLDNTDELIRNVERNATTNQVNSISSAVQATKTTEETTKVSEPINLDELNNLFNE